MKSILIVTHCWRYSRALRWQLDSLLRYPPKSCEVCYLLVCHEGDNLTLAYNGEFTAAPRASNVFLFAEIHCNLENVLCRGRRRDWAARNNQHDIVWFADADYVFGPGCLDALAEADLSASPLWFPRMTRISKDHSTGDRYLQRGPDVQDLYPDDFAPKRERMAIGGIQIVPGEVARERGYLPPGYVDRPRADGKFQFRSDIAFRKMLGTAGKPLELPNLYRIRQTTSGVVDTL